MVRRRGTLLAVYELRMARETHKAKLIGEAGAPIEAEFILDSSQRTCSLTIRFAGREIRASEPDYFEALCRIRDELESFHLRPNCYGASRNVFPSGMGRDMGSGLNAYKMKMGIQAKLEDLVFIFDSGPDVEPVSVAEQRAFFDVWSKSLR
jgi:hypothetical protein